MVYIRGSARFCRFFMSEPPSKPVFLVDAYSDPVVVRVEGRACFSNSADLQDFFSRMIGQGKTRFVMDLRNCASMDSTFLGVLAGEALELRRKAPPGSLVLCRVGHRNLELLRNLGLHRLLTVEAGDFPPGLRPGGDAAAERPGRQRAGNRPPRAGGAREPRCG